MPSRYDEQTRNRQTKGLTPQMVVWVGVVVWGLLDRACGDSGYEVALG
jgi:hypothetical protein